MAARQSHHGRHSHRGMDSSYNAYSRDDDYPGNSGQYEETARHGYDTNSGAGAGPAPSMGGGANQGAAPNARGRAATGGGGTGAGGGARNRSQSRGGGGGSRAGSQPHLASVKLKIQNNRCDDPACKKPVAWRNAEDVFAGTTLQGVNNSNGSGGLGPMYANQDERDYQMKLMDILNSTGLPLGDLAASTLIKGGRVPSFWDLPAGSSRGGVIPPTAADQPQRRTPAWQCAKFEVEKDRREFFFATRVIAQNIIFSPWCDKHTCRFFFSREQCMHKKVPFDAVCNTHTTCPVQSCPGAKTQNIDPRQSNGNAIIWLRDEFCKTHGCAEEGCGRRCDQTDDGTDLRFCPTHRCHYKGCFEKGQSGRGYCPKHKCQSQACQKIALPGFQLCKTHVECAQNKCTKPRAVVANITFQKDIAECGIESYDRRTYLLYCSDHAYCLQAGCPLLRKKPAVFCYKHVCNETGCGVGTTEELKFCVKHRCAQPQCIQPKAWKEDRKRREEFCLGHLCRDSDCDNGVGEDRLYCDIHECAMVGCASKETGNDYCINHTQIRSKEKGESDAHAKTERLARALHPLRGGPPEFPGYHYAGHPFTNIGSVYGGGSASSRSSASHSSRTQDRHGQSGHRSSRHAPTSARGRTRASGASFSDSAEEDTGESSDSSRVSRGRPHRDSAGNGMPLRDGRPNGAPNMPDNGAPRPSVSQQHPPMPNGGGPGRPGGPGGPGGGPSRQMPPNGVRPTGNGAGAGAGPGGQRGGPPQNMGGPRNGQASMVEAYSDDE